MTISNFAQALATFALKRRAEYWNLCCCLDFAPTELSSKYHSQPEKARSTFFHSWCPGRSPVILCWSAQLVTAEISSLLYPSWSSFLTRVLRGIWPATPAFVASFNRCSFDNGLQDLANLSSTHPFCFVPNVGFWLVVDCKVQWTPLFKFTWSAADKFLQNAN